MDDPLKQDNNQSQTVQDQTNPVGSTGTMDPNINPVVPDFSQVGQPIVQQSDVQASAVPDPVSQSVQEPVVGSLTSPEPEIQLQVDPQPVVQQVQPDIQLTASEPTSQQSTPGQLTPQQEDAMVDMLMDKVFARVGQMLTEDEMKQVEELDKTDINGENVKQFLQTKGIDIDKIMQEEMEKLKEEASK